ncbi:hypothetical protein GW17_00058711 [Ensete ventricosum]|nr:hypothetical protein GW17_00058711 [Ensete ventricosum]
MRSLFLSHNRFDGEIPDVVFGSMRRLKKLWLDHNQFSGPIPTSIFNATKLTELRLDDNAFDGLIPSLNLSSLKSFNASNNRLTGPIPTSLARFDASSFAGNPDLCGPPLSSTPCPTPSPPPTMVELPKEQSSFGKTLAILVGIAVAVAAVIAIVTLLRGRRREDKFDTLSMVASAEAMESAAAPAPPQAELLDRVIASQPSTGDMVRLLRVGAACVDPDPEQRPEMADVAVLIGEIAEAAVAVAVDQ